MAMTIPQDRLLDRQDVADLLGIAPQTLAVWAMTGKYLPVVKIGRRVKYRESDVRDFIDRSTRPASA